MSQFISLVNNDSIRKTGSNKYKWRTQKDSRVRLTHRKLEGKIFSFDKPPIIDGRPLHPGEDYNCRCVAIPVKVKKAKETVDERIARIIRETDRDKAVQVEVI